MEAAMSTGEDPLWIVPYTTIAADFQDLLDDYTTYIDVRVPAFIIMAGSSSCAAECCYTSTHRLSAAAPTATLVSSCMRLSWSNQQAQCLAVLGHADAVMGQVHSWVIVIYH